MIDNPASCQASVVEISSLSIRHKRATLTSSLAKACNYHSTQLHTVQEKVPNMPSLTSHLINLDETGLKEATTHPFLKAAATSSLPLPKLQAWLAQDRLYALSYVNFAASLLARVPASTSADRPTSLAWRTTDLLIDSLTNIRAELKLFEDTAAHEGWLDAICNIPPTVPTRAYQDLFAGATTSSRPLVVGLTVLWATEECYLRSWRYAWSNMDFGLKARDKDVMQRVFIPNWSSGEFEAFVRRIGAVLNKFGSALDEGGEEWIECEAAYRQVLWAEKAFWPKMDEVRFEEDQK
ncbi:Hypothetical protein R9X50_00269700 [Acrodontium crateriforme]|uniref:Thiaminase-2/PQQC domain-containing protein n=1 Tax=Acrodontium crateriforme TaxID=150365 RepID=A0AAQ3RB72_9PEZI|nr:Hypothetical protein R9X50_00269700 [Acrodontium crateriforme]